MASKKIAVLVGSLRKDSYTRRVAHSLIELAPKGTVDVVVCDGFVGNVMLKAIEGLSRFMKTTFKESIMSMLGAVFARKALKKLNPVVVPGKERVELRQDVRFRGLIFLHVLKHHGPDQDLAARVLSTSAFRLGGPLLGLLFLLERFELFQLLFLRLDPFVQCCHVVAFCDVGGRFYRALKLP